MAQDDPAVEAVLAYHRRTKHHLHRYAASPGYLDWATQPDPFRTFGGADRVELPLLADRLAVAYAALYRPGAVPPLPLDQTSVAMLFELALGLSAWKQYAGNRWALRCNPSSGNLHPTEGYAILPAMPGLAAGVYHYVSRDHALERRCALDGRAARQLAAALPPASCLVGLSSIHWREAWKYGERAFRYCQHDVGHAIAAVRYAAATLGWSARLLADVSDPDHCRRAGAGPAGERRRYCRGGPRASGRCCYWWAPSLRPAHGEEVARVDLATLGAVLQAGTWSGRANPLSPAHVPWPAIDTAAEATWRADGAGATLAPRRRPSPVTEPPWGPRHPMALPRCSAVRLIKQRRSCLALDGTTAMEAARFYAILDRLLPRPAVPPWDVWPWPAHLHCGIFVHRVRGVPPGLYLLERNRAAHARLRASLGADFSWTRPDGCPESLPLFALARGRLPGAGRGGELPSGDRRGRRLQSRHDCRFCRQHPGRRGLVVSPTVLGIRPPRAGAVPRSRGGGPPGHRDRLLLRRRVP